MTERGISAARRLLREPLLHFAGLGLALAIAHAWLAPPPARQITLSDDVLQGLRRDHQRRAGALPSPEEEAGLVRRFVDDEVLYREALALGLDRGDVIVRRRLVQKMRFLLDRQLPAAEPDAAQLEAFRRRYRERYVRPAGVAIRHVFVSRERYGDGVARAAVELAVALRNGAAPAGLGDPFIRGAVLSLRPQAALAAIFGPGFAAAVMALPVGEWSPPLESRYGMHLVRVDERREAADPPLAEVRAALERDWRAERAAAEDAAALARLRAQYDVEVVPRSAAAAWAAE